MSNPAGTAAPVTPTEQFVALMVEAHNARTIAESHAAERRARIVARQHGLDEFALEPRVRELVFAGMSDDELAACLTDPSRRGLVRAEQRRRAGL